MAARKTSELLESQHQLLLDSQDVQGVSIQETSPRSSTGTSSDHDHGDEGEGGGHHHHNHDRGGETEGEDTPAGPGLGLGTPALQDGGVAGVGEGGDVAGGGAGRLQRPGSVAPVLMAFNMWDAQKDLVTDFFPHRPARVVAVPRSRSGEAGDSEQPGTAPAAASASRPPGRRVCGQWANYGSHRRRSACGFGRSAARRRRRRAVRNLGADDGRSDARRLEAKRKRDGGGQEEPLPAEPPAPDGVNFDTAPQGNTRATGHTRAARC